MSPLRLAYLALAGGLMSLGGMLIWLGLRRPPRPAGTRLRMLMVIAALLAVAGVAAAVVLEARATRPW